LKGIYIRSVYFLGITAGGSVTHTSGVINAMSEQIDLDIWANEQLPDVKPSIHIIPPTLPKVPFFGELLYNLRILKKLSRNKTSYDFVYQRYSGESYSGARFSGLRKIPYVLEFNSSEVWKLKNWSRTNNPFKNFLKKYVQLPVVKRIETYNLNQASLIVVVSQVLKDNLIQEGIDANKILVNPNGVDIDRFKGISKDEDLLKQLGLNDNFVFGFIGTFGKWHGVLELVKAAHQFYKNNPELSSKVKFLMIGDGKLFSEVKQYIRDHNLEEHIVLTGRVSQQENVRYLGLSDAFVSPHIPNPDGTRFFGSPTKLFEYMACKKPIIASELDQIGEILQHNKTALLTVPGDTSDLANAFHTLYEDEILQVELAANAYQQALDQHGWDSHVAHILDSIRNLSKKK
jgi:glycosyltransferase involved in cell wall biosynthesis